MKPLKIIRSHGIVPVLGLKDPLTAPMVATALKEGGLPLMEITMRAPKAMDCLRTIKAEHPDMLVGAGTILRPEQVDEAARAGADFIVTPGFNPKVVTHALEAGLPIVPGCVTPTEIEAGLELGLNTFKFFPAESLGGIECIRQLCGPYQGVRFVPTSGITLQNMAGYLSYDRIAAVGGSFMAPAALIDAQDWAAVTALCREAVSRSLGFTLAHIGINGQNESDGMAAATWFAERFGFPVKPGTKSTFAGTAVECCNMKFPGQLGHIAISTLSIERAVAHLQTKGVKLREEFRAYDNAGNLKSVYLEEEICGFAVHVLKA